MSSLFGGDLLASRSTTNGTVVASFASHQLQMRTALRGVMERNLRDKERELAK